MATACSAGALTGCEAAVCGNNAAAFEPWDVEIGRNTSGPKLALIVGGAGSATCGLAFSSIDDGSTWTKDFHECKLPGNPCANDPTYLFHDNPATLTDTWHLMFFRSLYGVSILSGDNTATAAGYNGQHVVRNPANGVWYDRSSFSNRPIEASTAVVFPLYGAVANNGSAGTGKTEITGSGGHIRRSVDGGTTWSDDVAGVPWRVSNTFFVDDAKGFQVGQFFRIARTLDGGTTWAMQQPIPQLGTGAFAGVTFDSSGVYGVVVGDSDTRASSAYQDHPKILYTTNGGLPPLGWIEPTSIAEDSSTNSLLKTLRAVAWVSGQTFWTAGDAGLIYFTTDGGANWTQYYDPAGTVAAFQTHQFTNLAFLDTNNGVFVGYDQPTPTSARAWSYKNTGGPTTWTEITAADSTINRLTDVEVHGNVAYAVGEKTVSGVRQGVILTSTYASGTFG